MAGVIIPNVYVGTIENPLVFLAGPILGAPNWQDQAITVLFSYDRNLTIASPRRGVRETIAPYILAGDDTHFPRQRAWERHHLPIASRTGAIVFWLPGEENHDCQKVYGAMTRVELGQWMTRYRFDHSVRFCVGSDGHFPELDIIEFDLSLDAPDKKIHQSLEETCAEAVKLARGF